MLRTLVKTQSQKSYWRSQSRSPPKASVQHGQFQWNEGKIIWVKGCKKLVVVIETSSLWSQFSQPGTRAATATNLWTTGATVFQPATAEFGDDTHDRVLTTKISRSLKKLLGLHENHVTPNPRVVAKFSKTSSLVRSKPCLRFMGVQHMIGDDRAAESKVYAKRF